MSFTLGISWNTWQEGLCDILLANTLTIQQLQDIITIAEPALLNRTHTIDTLMSIADIIGPGNTVELDLNLQHYGMKQFGKDAVNYKLHFVRHDRQWPENGFTYTGDINTLHSFLFE